MMQRVAVDQAIQTEVRAAYGTYDGPAVDVSLALQQIAGAMEESDPADQRARVRNALCFLRDAGLVIATAETAALAA